MQKQQISDFKSLVRAKLRRKATQPLEKTEYFISIDRSGDHVFDREVVICPSLMFGAVGMELLGPNYYGPLTYAHACHLVNSPVAQKHMAIGIKYTIEHQNDCINYLYAVEAKVPDATN